MIKKQKNKIAINHPFPTGILVLDNKLVFRGIGLGYQGTSTGEVCFNTSLTGYQEIISDPSYAGQIINFTFPHIGNVGTNNEDLESDKIWTKGVIFNSEITSPSNYRALQTLDKWLKKNQIVGLTGLDTRGLTNFIRDKGAPKGTIANNKKGKFNIKKLTNMSVKWPGLNGLDLAKEVSTKKTYIWKGFKTWKKEIGYKKNIKTKFKIVAIDYGIKKNILRYFSDYNCEVKVVSCKKTADEIIKLNPDGIFLSNGPGDPAAITYGIKTVQNLLKIDLPIFGICLGHQLLALACGAKTTKMKFGHHGGNIPVKNMGKGSIEITSQNHNFAIESGSVPNVTETHVCLNDGSLSGLKCNDIPAFSVQYHPEASPGPHDSRYLFREFADLMSAFEGASS